MSPRDDVQSLFGRLGMNADAYRESREGEDAAAQKAARERWPLLDEFAEPAATEPEPAPTPPEPEPEPEAARSPRWALLDDLAADDEAHEPAGEQSPTASMSAADTAPEFADDARLPPADDATEPSPAAPEGTPAAAAWQTPSAEAASSAPNPEAPLLAAQGASAAPRAETPDSPAQRVSGLSGVFARLSGHELPATPETPPRGPRNSLSGTFDRLRGRARDSRHRS